MKKSVFRKLVYLSLAVVLYSCNSDGNAPKEKHDFTIAILAKKELPYRTDSIIKNEQFLLNTSYSAKYKDGNGIPLFMKDNKKHYNPVGISQIGLDYMNKYDDTKNKLYIDSAAQYAKCLLNIATTSDDALWFPYTFNFNLHDFKDQTMAAPWYSAMAQGQALSLFVRLYEATGNKTYSQSADKIFASFTIVKNDSHPWVILYDDKHALWLEEYPMDEPEQALNGFIFAIFGIYDYYRIHPDRAYVKHILVNSISTIYNNIHKFEKKDEYSYYCLKHQVRDRNYHYAHIYQLKILYNITNEPYFLQMANNFWEDGKVFEKKEHH